jgi:Helix-turn-helix domain
MGKRKTVEAAAAVRLVSAMAAARELGVPYTSLRDAAFRGEILVVKVGRAWYFDRADLARFVVSAKQNLAAR